MIEPKEISEKFWRANPLVPAAAIFLLGVTLATQRDLSAGGLLCAGAIAWLVWIVSEWLGLAWIAQSGLAILVFAGGAATYTLNQHYAEPQQIARFAGERETMVAMRARVDVAPDDAAAHGNEYWVGHASGIWTDHGWLPARGDLLVQWGGKGGGELRRGMEVELYGWLSLPETAKNPGAINPRRMLAADRIFAQIRVPRATGVIILNDASASGADWLTRMRLYLRGKLLEHTIQQDVPAALTLTALLLGHRDPAIADVSQAFSNAGIAHLLAISGSHLVFFTGLVWAVLRYLPLRPRHREILIAAIVGLYVLATPGGPPIIRAAAVLFMVLLGRMLGRPREYLNMLAGAAVLVVLLRPADIADAGFQLSFITTAGLILFSKRLYTALFEQPLAREALAAALGGGLWAQWRYRILQAGAVVFVANLIGGIMAGPLVAYHFGQINPWAIVSGIVAIPFVFAAMAVAAVQLLATLAGVGGWLAPLSVVCGRALIWIVTRLAALPGSAISLRAPPTWCVTVLYAVVILWAMRRRLNMSRAVVVNLSLAAVLACAAWYCWSTPTRGARVTVLSAGSGDCILVQTPRGLWAVDASMPQGSSLVDSAVRPALRVAGIRQLNGQIMTSLLPSHAAEAQSLIATYRPVEVFAAANAWQHQGETFAGTEIANASGKLGISVKLLAAGDAILLAPDCRVEALWPPRENDPSQSLLLRLVCGRQRVLIVDPKSEVPLARLPIEVLQCEAVIFTGPRRGDADAFLIRRASEIGARHIIWCGRGAWAQRTTPAGEWNTADGAVQLDLSDAAISIRGAAE